MNQLINLFFNFPQTEAVVLGGSRSGNHFDEKSDYDVYIYVTKPIPEDDRTKLYQKYCKNFETSNHYFEYEDNCILNDDVPTDIIFRNPEDIEKYLKYVVDEHHAFNGYTTCFWHNVINSQILFDRNGWFTGLQKKYTIPYPVQLKNNIIERNMNLLTDALPAYDRQILKAINRNDFISINHRTAAFMESYFDIIFAMNEKTHPGEKRLTEICQKECCLLPEHFEENIHKLLSDIVLNQQKVKDDLDNMVIALKKILSENGLYQAGVLQ